MNEGVDCGVKIALSFVLSSYPMLLDVALSGTVQCAVEWYSTKYRECLLWKGKDRPKWLGSNGWTASHRTHFTCRHSNFFRLMQRSVIGLSLAG